MKSHNYLSLIAGNNRYETNRKSFEKNNNNSPHEKIKEI